MKGPQVVFSENCFLRYRFHTSLAFVSIHSGIQIVHLLSHYTFCYGIFVREVPHWAHSRWYRRCFWMSPAELGTPPLHSIFHFNMIWSDAHLFHFLRCWVEVELTYIYFIIADDSVVLSVGLIPQNSCWLHLTFLSFPSEPKPVSLNISEYSIQDLTSWTAGYWV